MSTNILPRIVIIAASLLFGACTYAPVNNEWVDWTNLQFQGYAQNPSAQIEVQVYHKRDATWKVVKLVTASGSGTTLGGDTLYSWNTSLDFTTVYEWTCYWGYGTGCSIPAGSAAAQFRFKERGSDTSFMATFDDDGLDCVMDKLTDGVSWIGAGASCASSSSPILTLKVLT